jgi:hypothetical protein
MLGLWWARLLNNVVSIFSGVAAAGDYESIATVTVGAGGSATVSFTSIPSTYAHLQVRALIKNTSTDTDAYIQLNSDVNSVYRHQLIGNGSNASASANSGISYILLTPSSTPSSTFGVSVIDILDYKNTNKAKTIRALSGYDTNGGGLVGLGSALWTSTDAVTTIKLVPAGGNFAQYSHFALYGIKSA